MNKPNCKDCPDRYVTEHSNCHATCESYLEFARQRKEMLEQRRKEKQLENDYVEVLRGLKK